MHCITYFSALSPHITESDVLDLLQESRRNNERLGVTGLLLHVRGSILQVLEGDKQTVEQLYQRIEQDSRHYNVNKVLARPIERRLFSGWAMGYETFKNRQLDDIEALNNLDATPVENNQAADHIVLRTIRVFYETNRYNK